MRIAAISDLHGQFPVIPPCDLLIVAGDVCPDAFQGRLACHEPELQKAWFDRVARPWLAAAPATHKILTWGNHDWCGEKCRFDADAGGVADSRALQILLAQPTEIHRQDGEPLRIWASPWSNQFGAWAFMREPARLAPIYDAIPAGIDILVSHQPPYGYCDGAVEWGTTRVVPTGSRELIHAIDRVKPKVVICGHIHEGHGRARYGGCEIYNVSVVDERYRLVHAPTVMEL